MNQSSKLKSEIRKLKREVKQLRLEVTRDHLTNLFNNRALSGFLDEQVSLVKRYKQPLSIMLIDFDNLKKYNDKYGHLQGNQAIKTAALIMQQSIRKSDVVGRWTSGEEFLIILPETNRTGAYMAAEKIRKNIDNTRIKAASKNIKPGYHHITVSIGVAEYKNNVQYTLKNADSALYKAKHLGRNKVIMSEK